MATTAVLWRANWPYWFKGDTTRPIWGPNVKVALYSSSWSPNADTETGYSTTNELTTANGYTQGGVAIASPTCTYTAAASLSAWTTSTAYVVGDCVKGTGSGAGRVYRCTVAGTSGGSCTFNGTVGETVTDGTCSWNECGLGIVKLDCADPQWTASGVITFRYAAFYDNSGTGTITKPYICYLNYGSDQSSGTSGTLTLTLDALGQIVFPMY